MAEHRIWGLGERDAEAAGAVLGRAFIDEPVFVAALPDRADRLRLCAPLFEVNLRHACRYGGALAVGAAPGAPLGVAYWTPRPEPRLSAEVAADLGFSALGAEWGAALARLGGLEAEGARALAGLPEPWRYLGAIGVEPARQGAGLGTTLLGRILADAAAAGVPVGLMTDRAANVPFYRRAGFHLVADGATADGNVPWWSFATTPPG